MKNLTTVISGNKSLVFFAIMSIAIMTMSSAFPVSAQQNANYELANKFKTGNLSKYIYDSTVRPNWIDEGDMFWYTYRNSDGRNYYLVDPVRKTKQPVFDNARFAAALSEKINQPIDPKKLPVLDLKFIDDMQSVEFDLDTTKIRYELNLTTYTIDSIGVVRQERGGRGGGRGGRGGGRGGRGGGRGGNFRNFSPDSTVFAYAKNYNLYIMGADSVENQISLDGEEYYSFGGDTSETRKVRASVSWSEDSKNFHVRRSDSRKVKDLFLVNEIADPRPTLQTYKYAMPGDENVSQYELFTYEVASSEFNEIETYKWKDQRLSGTRWGKNTNELYFQRKERTQDRHEVVHVDLETGEQTVLIEEYIKDSYVETKGISYINDFSEMIWWSERTGWGHFYLYDGNGNLKNPITSGEFLARSVARIDTTKRVLYITANGKEEGENPYYSHLYRVNFDGSAMELLNPGNGSHSTNISPTNNFFVDTYSRVDAEPKSVLRDTQGAFVMELESTDMSGLEGVGWQFPVQFKVKSADGVLDIYGVMWKPFDFDPEKKYPIIAHVYPGPQTESVPFTFTPSNRNVPLSQLGFIVIAIGNRGGSPQRSKAYHNYGYGDLRDYGLADKKAGIEQLASRFPFIDIERVGIYGHSGGGFMSTAAMVVPPYNDFFKVAVSSSGNHDNNIYNQNWSEKHHGVKGVIVEEDSSGGKRTNTSGNSGNGEKEENGDKEMRFEIDVPSNVDMAENLKGHLLLTTGTIDNNVHPGNTVRMVNALIEANKRFDYMVLPGKRHGYGDMNDYFVKLLWDYFSEHLIGDSHNNVNMFDFNKK